MKLPRYNSPLTQIVLVSFVCFGTVGMFSAISNLGAGGTQNIVLSNITNAVLYTCFSLAGIFSGSVNNILGPKLTLFIGSIGYALYVAALWVYQTRKVEWFLILSGAILGVCAALLWSAQGAIMMSYPVEQDKGRAFSIFWVIFNSGSLMGGLIALGINVSKGAVSETATSTYIAFLVVILCGIALTWAVLPPGRIVRSDDTIVKIHSYASPREEVRGLWALFKTKNLLFLVPLFFSSNYFYSYQGALAVAIFDAETRALNGVVKSIGQIVGAIIIGIIMDKAPLKRRRNRGLAGLGATAFIIMLAYGWGVHYQMRFTRETTPEPKINFRHGKFGEPIAILSFYDVGDAMVQGAAYWIMSAMTNDIFILARYAGLYKAIQSAGAAVSFGVDATAAPYLNELLSCWMLLIAALIGATYVVWNVKDTNYDVEEVVHVGETYTGDDGQVHVVGDSDMEKDVGATQVTAVHGVDKH